MKSGDFYTNVKNGKLYRVICKAINATNSRDGEIVVIYCDDQNTYVREIEEFKLKFTNSKA